MSTCNGANDSGLNYVYICIGLRFGRSYVEPQLAIRWAMDRVLKILPLKVDPRNSRSGPSRVASAKYTHR